MENELLQIAAIALASIASQWVGWKLRLPAIVFLLLSGFFLGPLLDLLHPQELMGTLLHPAITAAVAIILFEGSLSLKIREISDVRAAVQHMVLIGAPLGWLLISVGAHFVAGLSWPVAIIFGGILVVTGHNIIRSAPVTPRVNAILKWEGIVNDPLGVIFAVLAYEYFHFFHNPVTPADGAVFYLQYGAILIGVLIGSYGFARVTAAALERGYLPEYLKAPFLVTVVLVLYTCCDLLMHESGLIAVAVFGMTLANIRVGSIEEIRRFKETITLLLVSGIFILLTASLDPTVLLNINYKGLLFIFLLMFVIRPLTVIISSLHTGMSWKEIAFVSWIGPRGVVCVAVTGVIQPLLIDAGYAGATQILPLAFGIVVITVVVHSLTVKWLARKLNLLAEHSGGLIIAGASEWTLQLAETLMQKQIPVVIADNNWHDLKDARLANIPTFYGELLSEEAEFNMDTREYGALLAATDNSAYNALLCNFYAAQLGREHVYQLSAREESGPDNKKVAMSLQGRIFVEAEREYKDWWRSFTNGWRFRLTTINPEENEGKLILKEEEILVGIINKHGILSCRTADYEPPIKDGDLILLYSRTETS